MASRIIIVDDDEYNLTVLESYLDGDEYTFEFALNGQQALDKIATSNPDLILLDVMMPGMDGFELCRIVRETPAIREIPIIMITALDDQTAMVTGFESGADDFLHKPVNRTEFRAKVRSITRLNRYRTILDERERLAKSRRAIKDTYEETMVGWTRALELRDQETEDHSERVTEMTLQLARLSHVEGAELEAIRRGALLHDIGKIGVPDTILHKPGPLDEKEWAIMKQHPYFGYRMLEPIDYLKAAIDIPYCHHEKWDGSGYPRGLRGIQIPYAARIFAIADVWDALTNSRIYRTAWSEEDAMAYILKQAGKHFDPDVVLLFWGLIKSLQPEAQSAANGSA